MSIRKVCDVCQMHRQKTDPETMQPVPDVFRYTLRREQDQRMAKGVRSGRYQKSAGGIDLCGPCWERICKPNMNPNKASRRKHAAEQGEARGVRGETTPVVHDVTGRGGTVEVRPGDGIRYDEV